MVFFPCKRCKNDSLIQREILISRAEDKIAEYLDVYNYTNLNENFLKIKSIILNKCQIISFEYLKNQNLKDFFIENYDEKLLELIEYYKQKIKQSNLNEYNQKLLDNFREEFKDLIIT